MKKNEKQKRLCETILKDKNFKMPTTDDEALMLCMQSSITGICLEYLGHLDNFPAALGYIRGRGGVLKVEKDNIMTLRETLESMHDDAIESAWELPPYNPSKDGAVNAINIFLEDYHIPCATLAFAFGGSVTVRWDNEEIRHFYRKGINAYTIVFDERTKGNAFQNFLKDPM